MDYSWIIHKLQWTLRPEKKRNFQSQKTTNLMAQKCMIFKAQKLYGVRPQKLYESKGPKTDGNDGPRIYEPEGPPKMWFCQPMNFETQKSMNLLFQKSRSQTSTIRKSFKDHEQSHQRTVQNHKKSMFGTLLFKR